MVWRKKANSIKSSEYEGKQDKIKQLNLKKYLERVRWVYEGQKEEVYLYSEEFNSICPKTGLPDFATISIKYYPGAYLVEEKSLKIYLTQYRNVGIFQENACIKIQQDLQELLEVNVLVVMEFKARGGISVEVKAGRLEDEV